ncbi:TPA: hypothetical protein DEP21_04390 [Patescibacteria group bacterium]|nr:hypothetical protein [Candidatus Gracilibacteria bacterium]
MEYNTYVCKRDGNSLPEIDFDFEKKIFCMKGSSSVSDPEEFYKKLETIIRENGEKLKNNSVNVICEFDYINTGSTKCIYNLIKRFCEISQKVLIEWNHAEEDEDTMECGMFIEEELLSEYKNFSMQMIKMAW